MMEHSNIEDNSLEGYSGCKDTSIQKNASDKLSLKWIATANNAPTL